MNRRNTILTIAAALLLAIAAFFVWRHVARLGEQLGDLWQAECECGSWEMLTVATEDVVAG